MGRFGLLTLTFAVSLLSGCLTGGKNFSQVLAPSNLRENSSKSLIDYSRALGSVRRVSQNLFFVESSCLSKEGQVGCPVGKVVEKFYSAYCRNNGGSLSVEEFLKEKLARANGELDRETKASGVPDYYLKLARDYSVTISGILGFTPKLSCYLPSKGELFFVDYSYSCFRLNEFWTKCPYQVKVADFTGNSFDLALRRAVKKVLKDRQVYLLNQISEDRTTTAYYASFKLPSGLKVQAFLYPQFARSSQWELLFRLENPTSTPVLFDLGEVGVISVISDGRRIPSLGAEDLKEESRGECEKIGGLRFTVFPGGRCEVEVRGLRNRVPDYSDRGRFLIFKGLKFEVPFKRTNLFEVRKRLG